METLAQFASAYITERLVRGHFRPKTAETVRYTLVGLVHHAPEDPAQFASVHVEGWLAATKMGPATARSRLSQVRGFCRWLRRKGLLSTDPTLGVDGPRMPRYVPRGLKEGLVGAALGACPDSRARLIVLLMAQEGLRCLEVANLELGDVDFDERLMLVRGKGGHERVLPLTEETWGAMAEYLTEHPIYAGSLVRSYNDAHRGIDASYISTLVARWLRAAGVEATAHALRHTAASDMLRNGAHLRDVQAALGHVSLSTTQRYLPWVVGDLRQAMSGRRYGPAARPVEATG
jgi:integrase/recombinase XerD